MKSPLILFLMMTLASFAEEAPVTLDTLLEERIKINEKYRDKYSAEAEELEKEEARDFLIEGEKKNGQLWVDFLKRVKASKDPQLKILTLRMEVTGEINNSYYDLEYVDGFQDEMAARGAIARWKKKLRQINDVVAKLPKKGIPSKAPSAQ